MGRSKAHALSCSDNRQRVRMNRALYSFENCSQALPSSSELSSVDLDQVEEVQLFPICRRSIHQASWLPWSAQ